MQLHKRRFPVLAWMVALCLLFGLLGCADHTGIYDETADANSGVSREIPPVNQPSPVHAPTKSLPDDHRSKEKKPVNSEDNTYTFVWMSDTQLYSQAYPEIYLSMTQWIQENLSSYNLCYVFHTGDVINKRTRPEQWAHADAAMGILDGVIPYSIAAGNHDVGRKKTSYEYFLHSFGEERFAFNTNKVLFYRGGEARAEWLDVGTLQFLIIAMGWNPKPDETIAWINELLQENPNRIAILITHNYLQADGSLSANGSLLYHRIVLPHPNLRMVLCGHNHNAVQNTAEIDDNGDEVVDRRVYQLLADYQETENGGNGFMRLLTISEQTKELRVTTYSPYLDQYHCFDPQTDAFTLSIADWFPAAGS